MNVDPRLNAKAPTPAQNRVSPLETLLALEGDARGVNSYDALGHFMCNETRKLVSAKQILFLTPGAKNGQWRLKAASSVSSIDRNAPMVRQVEKFVSQFDDGCEIIVLTGDHPTSDAFNFEHGLLVPLIAPRGTTLGRLMLLRERSFSDGEKVLMQRVSTAYAHALSFFHKSKRTAKLARNLKFGSVIAVAIAALAMLIPVPMSILAPVEVVARDPKIVTAPLDGVVKNILVEPNQPVKKGDLLFSFDDTELAGRFQVAERNLEVADARNRRVLQGASLSAEMRREIAVTKSELAVAQAERDEVKAAYDRALVYAPRNGVAIFASKDDWLGRPVATGERIMEIGDPTNVEFRIEVGVGDSIVLADDATVRVFLHNDPLSSIDASFEKASFRAERTADNRLAYMLKSYQLEQDQDIDRQPLRLGLRGTARVTSGSVSLGYYLFRRPISTARQWLGL